jgi:TRAP-type C4-dicarboxylate transport system permease small subunit
MSESAIRSPAPAATAPLWAQSFTRRWHRSECVVAVLAYGLIALLLILDVTGREVLGPIFHALGIKGATGLYGAQKASVYALVLASFCGIGVATATGSHLVPRVGFGWIPASWGAGMDRLADVLTGLFMVGVAYYGYVFVASSFSTGLSAQAFNVPVWPFQMAIPLGFLSAAVRYFMYAAYPALRPLPPEFQE